MPRNQPRKTERHLISEEAIAAAMNDVLYRNFKIREAARVHNLTKSLLHKRLKKFREETQINNTNLAVDKETGEVTGSAVIEEPVHEASSEAGTSKQDAESFVEQSYDIKTRIYDYDSKYTTTQIFSKAEENMLCEYIKQCSKLQYGLTRYQIRELAYLYAKRLNKKYSSWDTQELAGIEWLRGFMSRHQTLSLRKPENTSMARLSNFNKKNVEEFFDNLEKLLDKYKFKASNILNLDECGVNTILQAPKIVAEKGTKQVGQAVSAERGELVTFCGIIAADGNALPPVYIFPRQRYKDCFLNGAPPGSLGLAQQTGWMTSTLFMDVIKHVKNHTHCNKENYVLLILDNHVSHVSLDVVLYCRENGIVLPTFPPHTTHRLQPLDVAVYRPFKSKLRETFNSWLFSNPGRRISIYEIASLTAKAFDVAFSRKNILGGFKKAGIFPFDRDCFAESDFTSSYSLSYINETLEVQSSAPSLQGTVLAETETAVDNKNLQSVESDKQNCSATDKTTS